MFEIIFPEVLAEGGIKHNAAIIKYKDTNLLIDPAIPFDKTKKYDINAIFITDSDSDHYRYISSYPKDIPIFSNQAILDIIQFDKERKVTALKSGGDILDIRNIRLIKLNPRIDRPAAGMKISLDGYIFSIAFEIPVILGKLEKNLMKNTIHIVGVGNYNEPNNNYHKITFTDYIKMCEEELKPKQIFITNCRKDIIDHKSEINNELKKWNGKILEPGDIISPDKLLIKKSNDINNITDSDNIIIKWKIPYKPEEYTNKQLADDIRLFIAVAAALQSGKKVEIQEGSGKYFTPSTLGGYAAKAYKEIAKRKKTGEMNYTVRENKNDAYEYLWKLVKPNLSKEEILILTTPVNELNINKSNINNSDFNESDINKSNIESSKIIYNNFVDLSYNLDLEYDILDIKNALKPQYLSLAKPAYRGDIQLLESDLKHIGWDKEELLIDTKCDGVRETAGKINGKGFIYTDPEDLKRKSPDISDRFPYIIKDLENILPDDTIVDAELIALSKDKKDVLHRTVINSLINSTTVDPELISDYTALYVFDILYYKGKDVRDLPLSERLKLLTSIDSAEHIWITKASSDLNKKADAYKVNGSDMKSIKKSWDIITNDKTGRPKFIAEGIMIKKLDHNYEYLQNYGWMKIKEYYEVDCVIFDIHKVKGSENTYNYYLGIDIDKNYAKKMLEDIKAKDRVVALYDGKLYKKRECEELLDKDNVRYMQNYGKSSNTNIKGNIEDILRCASEEILKNENSTNPDYPYYTGYINRAMQLVPEKKVSDSLDIFYRLSLLQPKRIPIEEIERWNQEDINKSLSEKWRSLSNDYKEKLCSCFECVSNKINIDSDMNINSDFGSDINMNSNIDSNTNFGSDIDNNESNINAESDIRNNIKKLDIIKSEWICFKCPNCNSIISVPYSVLRKIDSLYCTECNSTFNVRKKS